MGKIEGTIRSEIVRLAKREVRKIAFPLGREIRSLKSLVSQMRKAFSEIERFVALQKKELEKREIPLKASPEEVKLSRFSPRLIRSLRKRLKITQRELALLTGVTVGAIHQWESGIFKPRKEHKSMMVALRKLGRREVRRLLEERKAKVKEKKKQSRVKSPKR